ncbi:MAG TPA: hypothetical protein PLD25_13245 [Chloroflexota bacterium]|nr:hypothetical protein [Chloroflexota bacterium]
MKQSNVVLEALAPVVDGTAVLFGFFFLADLSAWFTQRQVTNVVALTLIYFAFCVAVYLIRKLEPQPPTAEAKLTIPEWLTARPTMTVLAALFGLTLAVLLLNQLGYWESIFIVDDRRLGAGESSAFFVYAPGAFIAASLFYILVLSAPTRETILLNSRRYVPLAALGLVGVNGMMVLLTAVFQSLSLPWYFLLPALLLLFGPPRVWYLCKRPSVLSLISFLLMLVLLVIR